MMSLAFLRKRRGKVEGGAAADGQEDANEVPAAAEWWDAELIEVLSNLKENGDEERAIELVLGEGKVGSAQEKAKL